MHQKTQAEQQREKWLKQFETGERLSPLISAHVKKIDSKTVIKYGEDNLWAEVDTLRLVKEKTNIPVPEVFDVWRDAPTGRIYIAMEFIEGTTLEEAWPRMDEVQKKYLIKQLKDSLNELRQLTATYIGGVGERECFDQWFEGLDEDIGPFQSHDSFVQAMIRGVMRKGSDAWCELLCSFIKEVPSHSQFVLTHGDLQAQNIMIKDGKLAGLIDWEMAGYYPPYWEYLKTVFWSDFKSCWIKDGIASRVLDTYPLEVGLLLHSRDQIW